MQIYTFVLLDVIHQCLVVLLLNIWLSSKTTDETILYINKVSCFDVQNSTIIVILRSNVYFTCQLSSRAVFKR